MGKTADSVSSCRQPGYRLYSSKKGGTRNVEAHCWGNLRVYSVGRLCGSGSCGFGEPCRGVGKVFYEKQMDRGEALQGSSSKRGHRLDPYEHELGGKTRMKCRPGLIESSMHKALGLVPALWNSGAHSNPSTWEIPKGGPDILCHLQAHSKFKANLGYSRPCL